MELDEKIGEENLEMRRDAAGFWVRFGGIVLDRIIILLPLSILFGVIQLIIDSEGSTFSSIAGILYFFYVLLIPISWNGYTVGKRIVNIRIVKHDTLEPPTIGNMLMRELVGWIIYTASFGIAVIVSCFMVALREDKRSIHDMIAGTVVVKANTSYMDAPEGINLQKHPSRF
ncbi:RDD family protein [compost metagenome]